MGIRRYPDHTVQPGRLPLWGKQAKRCEARYVYGTRRRISDAHKRERGCAIPGEICKRAARLRGLKGPPMRMQKSAEAIVGHKRTWNWAALRMLRGRNTSVMRSRLSCTRSSSNTKPKALTLGNWAVRARALPPPPGRAPPGRALTPILDPSVIQPPSRIPLSMRTAVFPMRRRRKRNRIPLPVGLMVQTPHPQALPPDHR
jgi:hypothetical protein